MGWWIFGKDKEEGSIKSKNVPIEQTAAGSRIFSMLSLESNGNPKIQINNMPNNKGKYSITLNDRKTKDVLGVIEININNTGGEIFYHLKDKEDQTVPISDLNGVIEIIRNFVREWK